MEDTGNARPSLFSAGAITRLLYYLAILSALVLLYGRGDFSTAGFLYQAF